MAASDYGLCWRAALTELGSRYCLPYPADLYDMEETAAAAHSKSIIFTSIPLKAETILSHADGNVSTISRPSVRLLRNS